MKRFLAIFLLILALCAALFVTMSVSFVSKGPEAVGILLWQPLCAGRV